MIIPVIADLDTHSPSSDASNDLAIKIPYAAQRKTSAKTISRFLDKMKILIKDAMIIIREAQNVAVNGLPSQFIEVNHTLILATVAIQIHPRYKLIGVYDER